MARDLYYTGIPLGRENRFKDNTVPFILYGGAASIVSSNILGEIPVEYGGGHSMVDACDYGFGEDRLNHIVRFLLENGIGKKDNKEAVLDAGTHEFPYLADPLAYDFVTDTEHPFRIKSISKNKEWLRDKVAIGNTYDTNYPGFIHKVFNLDGQNADSTDVMLSLGAVSGDTIISTDKGLIPIKCLYKSEVDYKVKALDKYEAHKGVLYQGKKNSFRVRLSNGSHLDASEDHKWMVS